MNRDRITAWRNFAETFQLKPFSSDFLAKLSALTDSLPEPLFASVMAELDVLRERPQNVIAAVLHAVTKAEARAKTDAMQARLKANHGCDVPRYAMKLKRYGDDLTLLHADTQLTENAEFAARDLSRATVLMVDDVLYQGHSLARLQAWLIGRGAPVIRAAVLADRCCAVLPMKADIVGVRLQVAPSDVVECNVPPYEETFRIEVLRPRR